VLLVEDDLIGDRIERPLLISHTDPSRPITSSLLGADAVDRWPGGEPPSRPRHPPHPGPGRNALQCSTPRAGPPGDLLGPGRVTDSPPGHPVHPTTDPIEQDAERRPVAGSDLNEQIALGIARAVAALGAASLRRGLWARCGWRSGASTLVHRGRRHGADEPRLASTWPPGDGAMYCWPASIGLPHRPGRWDGVLLTAMVSSQSVSGSGTPGPLL